MYLMVKKSVPSGYHNGLLCCISVSFPTCSLLVFILLLSHLGCKSQMLCLWLLCSTEGKQGKPLPPWVFLPSERLVSSWCFHLCFFSSYLPSLASETLNGALRRSEAQPKLFRSRIKIHAVWTSQCLAGLVALLNPNRGEECCHLP